jgi:hypothetical protein
LLNRYRNYLNRQTFLGGDGRLRGYPSSYFVGKDIIAYNFEFRSRPLEILSCQLGTAAFYDVGMSRRPTVHCVHCIRASVPRAVDSWPHIVDDAHVVVAAMSSVTLVTDMRTHAGRTPLLTTMALATSSLSTPARASCIFVILPIRISGIDSTEAPRRMSAQPPGDAEAEAEGANDCSRHRHCGHGALAG